MRHPEFETPPTATPMPRPRRKPKGTTSDRGEAPYQERTGGSIPLPEEPGRGGEDEMRHRQACTASMEKDPDQLRDMVGYVEKQTCAVPLPRPERDTEGGELRDESAHRGRASAVRGLHLHLVVGFGILRFVLVRFVVVLPFGLLFLVVLSSDPPLDPRR